MLRPASRVATAAAVSLTALLLPVAAASAATTATVTSGTTSNVTATSNTAATSNVTATSGTVTPAAPAASAADGAAAPVPCVSDPDATAFAAQALRATGQDAAAGRALDFLERAQAEDGGVAGNGVENSNTTGVAGAALAAGRRTGPAGRAVAFLTGLQQTDAANLGAVNYRTGPFDASTAARATAQAILGLAGTDLVTVSRAGAAADTTAGLGVGGAAHYLAHQLVDGDHDEVTIGKDTYPDAGLTADTVLALDAAHAGGTAAGKATSYLQTNAGDYIGTGGESYAGSTAKLLLVAEAQDADPTTFGGIDLLTRLRAQEAPATAAIPGRFSDTSAYGDYSNAIGQSYALLALHRAGTDPSAAAVAALTGLQCADGGVSLDFRAALVTTPPVMSSPTTPPVMSSPTTTKASTTPRSTTARSTTGSTIARSTTTRSSTAGSTTVGSTGASTTSKPSTAVAVAALVARPAEVTAGSSTTLALTGFAAGETVRIELHSDPVTLTSATADGSGAATVDVTVPVGTTAGAHVLTATGQESGRTAAASLTVLAALASTGAPAGLVPAAASGAFLLLIGGGLLTAARRRTRPRHR